MSGSSLKVRWLASTLVLEQAWQEQDQEEKEEGKDGGELDKEGPSYQTEKHFSDLVDRTASKKDQIEGEDDRTPSSRQTSDSSSESDSDYDSSSDEANNTSPTKNPSPVFTSCVQEAQLSPDGSCVFTSDFNRTFSVYPVDTTPHSDASPRPLKPYAQFTSADPIWSFAINPLFNVNDAASTHILTSRRDRYITLHNALWDISHPSSPTQPVNISTPLNSYKLINPLTEAIIAPLSLAYSSTGSHFFAGIQNAIATFDLTYADAPVHSIPTIPSARSKLKGGGRGFKGWISALTVSPANLLAAGSRTRNIGIYDATSGEAVTSFSLPGTLDGRRIAATNLQHVMGDGVSQLKYSPCGGYLYVAERQSDVLLLYDVRNFSLALGYCVGRQALTKQRLGFDVWSAEVEGVVHEVWAGGTDGKVRVWRDPWSREGAVEADEVVQVGAREASVVGTMVHPNGGVAVAACGRVSVGEDGVVRGNARGGRGRPKCREWGSVEVLELS